MVAQNLNQNILMVGTGYVGLVTGAGLAKLGHKVTCQDINPERIALLKSGKAPFYEPKVNELMAEGVDSGNLSFHESLKEAYTGQRYIFIGVQTPQDKNGRSDLSMLRAAVTRVAETITEQAIMVVRAKKIFDGMRVISEKAARENGFSYRGVGHIYDGDDQPLYSVSDNPANFAFKG